MDGLEFAYAVIIAILIVSLLGMAFVVFVV